MEVVGLVSKILLKSSEYSSTYLNFLKVGYNSSMSPSQENLKNKSLKEPLAISNQ